MSVAELFAPLHGDSAAPSPVTFFVGGCDRSGTTLVGRLLAEELSLVALPEAYFHAVAYRRFGPRTAASTAVRHWRRRSWGMTAPHDVDGDLTGYLRSQISRLYEGRRGHGHPPRVVESTPENVEIGSVLLREFPEAHVVHVVRDPRSVAASLRPVDFGPRTAQECARLWKQRVASGLALESMYPDRVHRVRYEDALLDRGAIRRLGRTVPPAPVDFEPDRDIMIDHTSAAVQPRSLAELDVRRVWSWRHELTTYDVAAVEYECRELMRLFGYAIEGHPDARASTRRRLDTLRSAVGELTLGTPRRAFRAARAMSGRAGASL